MRELSSYDDGAFDVVYQAYSINSTHIEENRRTDEQ